MEISKGEVTAKVHDTLDLRASFLHYCASSMRPTEMQLAAEGPFMSAQQFTTMARDLGLVEPEGGKEQGAPCQPHVCPCEPMRASCMPMRAHASPCETCESPCMPFTSLHDSWSSSHSPKPY